MPYPATNAFNNCLAYPPPPPPPPPLHLTDNRPPEWEAARTVGSPPQPIPLSLWKIEQRNSCGYVSSLPIMKFGLPFDFPWFNPPPGECSSSSRGVSSTDHVLSRGFVVEQPNQKPVFNVKLWGWSLSSIIPWAINAKYDGIQAPSTINKGLRKHANLNNVGEFGGGSGDHPVRFRPYVSKVPWHTGARAFLSQLFPRYGHYCGPNWSSGKDRGSLLWDKRPIDWLDYCCYCHDIGYDTHDQAKLLEADIAFLECLERPHMATRGDARVANIYKMMCIAGLKNMLIPYRMQLVKLQSGQSFINFGWLSNVKWRSWDTKQP